MLTRSSTAFHLYAIASCLPRFGASARVNVADAALEVRARNRYFSLYPQFVSFENGEFRYAPHNHALVTGFAGWRPYFNKRWPAGFGKFAFKDFCNAHGLRTPRYDRSKPQDMPAFVIKTDRSSFGRGMRGPFRAGSPRAPALRDEGSYYEQFISGRILKASYWDARLL